MSLPLTVLIHDPARVAVALIAWCSTHCIPCNSGLLVAKETGLKSADLAWTMLCGIEEEDHTHWVRAYADETYLGTLRQEIVGIERRIHDIDESILLEKRIQKGRELVILNSIDPAIAERRIDELEAAKPECDRGVPLMTLDERRAAQIENLDYWQNRLKSAQRPLPRDLKV